MSVSQSAVPTLPTNALIEPSGTLDQVHHTAPPQSNGSTTNTLPVERTVSSKSTDSEGQALEWHEVIELQAFSERKVWIEEKIKLLEQMPPIQVFVGLDAIRASAVEVPGLPTQAELKDWLAEHDRIERETEVFDSGELKKLRKLTRAAAQRNLSPADTDLIELTLTTIYELDKLLHLLRDRSENLDLLGVRLTWEEKRIASWGELRNIVSDIETFLKARAHWSPAVYDDLESAVKDEDTSFSGLPVFSPKGRRGSVVSIASIASDVSGASLPNLSRGARFQLAEQLSREAAQLASRVSSLKHSKINAAGKVLDKLIDISRNPVPEELLDEQDRLEDKGINDMEDAGKFIMTVVMQWKKSDEVYVETERDKAAAQTLLEEIETAKLYHPTSRQDSGFLSRSNALSKRLLMRGNPAISSSSFPRPLHPLFPQQQSLNDTIVQLLSSEFYEASDLVRKVDVAAKQYHANFEAVKKVESACKAASDLSSQISSLINRLENGIETENGDGTPPDLSTDACLHGSHHSVYLALLPSVSKELQSVDEKASKLLKAAGAALLDVERPGIDPQFIEDSKAAIDHLSQQRRVASGALTLAASQVAALNEVRKIWTRMEQLFKDMEGIRYELGESIKSLVWKQQSLQNLSLLTPESPNSPLPVPALPSSSVTDRLSGLNSRFSHDICSPLATASTSIGISLKSYLDDCATGLSRTLDNLKHMGAFLESVRNQSSVMGAIQEEVQTYQLRIEELRIRYEDGIEGILSGSLSGDDIVTIQENLTTKVAQIRGTVESFTESFHHRIPFVAPTATSSTTDPGTPRKHFGVSTEFNLELVQQGSSLEFSVDPMAVDRAVRTDSNSFSMTLAGELDVLKRKGEHFRLAQVARAIDVVIASLLESFRQLDETLGIVQKSFDTVEDPTMSLELLSALSSQIEDLSQSHVPTIGENCVSVRTLLRSLDDGLLGQDGITHTFMIGSRAKAVESAELRFSEWKESTEALAKRIKALHAVGKDRLAEAARRKAERERLEAEAEAERKRLEAEAERKRIEEEQARAEAERLRVEEAARVEAQRRLEEETRAEAERIRLEAEAEAERLRLEEEAREQAERRHREAEDRQRREAETKRLEEEEKMRIKEEERKRAEEEERKRLEEERERCEEEERKRLEEEERKRLEEEERKRLEEEERKRLEEEKKCLEDAQAAEKAKLDKQAREQAETAPKAIERDGQVVVGISKTLRKKPKENGVGSLSPAAHIITMADKTTQDKREDRDRSLNQVVEEDVFGIQTSAPLSRVQTRETSELQLRVFSLRKRLRSINLDGVARPRSQVDVLSLPNNAHRKALLKQFSDVIDEVAELPLEALDDPVVDTELRSLREEVDAANIFMGIIHHLANVSLSVQSCDNAISDFLEHIDSFPSLPPGPLCSTHESDSSLLPEEQLSARLKFTESQIQHMEAQFALVPDDPRVISERDRVTRTWSELSAMGHDLLNGRKSRPGSVISSGSYSSRSSAGETSASLRKKKASYSALSASTSGGQFLTPPLAQNRRSVSGGPARDHSRSSSRASVISTARSVSGPLNSITSRLYNSTFASRQRTNSTTTPSSPSMSPRSRPILLPTRPRAQTNQRDRTSSPAMSDSSSVSQPRSTMSVSHSSTSRSTWARTPRKSFATLPRVSPPRSRLPMMRKPYIANPKSKLDVAVGDVVNKLPKNVNINVEVVGDTWRDQSGKYWIGSQDPKLCFCRILRSQTVMVRVGGGWSELSKFIQDHFADAFRILPESPPRVPGREEKWISSATLAGTSMEPPDPSDIPVSPPRTPEPKVPFLPSFALVTPSGKSPHSLKSTPSSPNGSPLAALQFIRRADRDSPSLRPETPSRSSRTPMALPSTPIRQPVWRP